MWNMKSLSLDITIKSSPPILARQPSVSSEIHLKKEKKERDEKEKKKQEKKEEKKRIEKGKKNKEKRKRKRKAKEQKKKKGNICTLSSIELISCDIWSPAYQHKFSVWEDDDVDDLHQGLIDVFLVWTSPKKQYWAILDPQFVLDYENHVEFGIFDAECGMMLDKHFGTKGHSTYVRPSIGFGGHRATEGSIEIGYKIIW